MGNLAERYGDCRRSGVYRVYSERIPLLAAAEAGARILEVTGMESLPGILQSLSLVTDERPIVVIVRDSCAQPGVDSTAQTFHKLQAACRERMLEGGSIFFVFVDPLQALLLPCLWNESKAQPKHVVLRGLLDVSS